ncbi:PTS sugar transporter subunit IIC [Enterococcus devriesei]|uniref:PTS sugar transporter subunit IIC n=1 Tax=Enterococcus devriesei TaxID=319970 RepID=UPI0036D2471D
MDKLEKYMLPLAERLDRNRYLNAIKTGFFLVTPLLIIGSMFLLISQIPSIGYQNFMADVFGKTWADNLLQINNATMNCMTFFVIIGMSYELAKFYKVDGLSCVSLALTAFLIVTKFIVLKDGNLTLNLNDLGASGLFVGMSVAIISSELFRWTIQKNLVIKLPESVPPNVATPFSALIPGFIIVIVFLVVRIIFGLTDYGSLQNFIFENLQTPLLSLGSSYPATILLLLFEALLWSLGIHGSNVMLAVMQPIWIALSTENAVAFANGQALPHIANFQFYSNFIKIGGASATLGLAIACLFFSKAAQYKTLGKLAIVPSIFNINEPLIFGMPIILNPIMIIPFILTPLVLCTLSFILMSTGIVPIANGMQIPWTTPPIIAGFFISGWRGALWNFVEIILSFAIYFPFFKVLDKESLSKE